MSSLHALGYVIARGLRGMGQAPLVQMLAVGTMAVCMLLLGAVVLVWINAQGMVRAWGIDVPMTVYLVDGADEAAVDELAARGVLDTSGRSRSSTEIARDGVLPSSPEEGSTSASSRTPACDTTRDAKAR